VALIAIRHVTNYNERMVAFRRVERDSVGGPEA
jgi:hypothetical protein